MHKVIEEEKLIEDNRKEDFPIKEIDLVDNRQAIITARNNSNTQHVKNILNLAITATSKDGGFHKLDLIIEDHSTIKNSLIIKGNIAEAFNILRNSYMSEKTYQQLNKMLAKKVSSEQMVESKMQESKEQKKEKSTLSNSISFIKQNNFFKNNPTEPKPKNDNTTASWIKKLFSANK